MQQERISMADARPDTFTISVVRTGGFAGLRREWRVDSADAPDTDWRSLVDACPWKTVPLPKPSPDRFVWRIEATDGRRDRRATLADSGLVGAWRALVDAVQAASKV
jgi:hypothetical protein